MGIIIRSSAPKVFKMKAFVALLAIAAMAAADNGAAKHVHPKAEPHAEKQIYYDTKVKKDTGHSPGPIHHAPVHHAPVHHAPVHHAPIHHEPIPHEPIHHAPVHHEPIHHAPI